MSLTAQGNSHLPTKIKTPNLHATRTDTHLHVKEPRNHKGTLSHARVEEHECHRARTHVHTHTRIHMNSHIHTDAQVQTCTNTTTTCFSKRDKNK